MTTGMIAREAHERPKDRPAVTSEAIQAFDRTCRYYLQMSGKEFLRRLDKGEFKHDPSNIRLSRVLAMLPFAR
jgi:hypothetical protein